MVEGDNSCDPQYDLTVVDSVKGALWLVGLKYSAQR